MKTDPLISVIVRTNNRPDILKTALNSIRRQTYQNIEVIIIEDGKNKSERMLSHEYSDLHYIYLATGEKRGRAGAGNIGLSLAKGEYFNFLDDDDEFYPEHIEKLLHVIMEENTMAAYSIAQERQIRITGRYPYVFRVKRKLVRYKQPFNRLMLYYQNYIPIQSILFSRNFYDVKGGFDERMDMLEDWDLWIRYSTYSKFSFLQEITSAYYILFNRQNRKSRDFAFYSAEKSLYHKFASYELKLNVQEVNGEVRQIIENYLSLRIVKYLRRILYFLLYGEK